MFIKKTCSVDIRLDEKEFRTLRQICNLARIAIVENFPINTSRDQEIRIRLGNLTEEEKERIIPFMKEIFNI